MFNCIQTTLQLDDVEMIAFIFLLYIICFLIIIVQVWILELHKKRKIGIFEEKFEGD